MTDRKPRIEEVVASLTARLAAAHEIRAHAAWLMKVADAQQDAARADAGSALGEHGERLYHVVSGAYDHTAELASRIDEVPGLAESLMPPWEAGRPERIDQAPPRVAEEPIPAAPPDVPVQVAAIPATVPSVPTPPRSSPPPPPAAGPAPPPPAPAATAGEETMYGLSIPRPNVASANKIVRQARELVATGDASHFETHGAKWVGVHQWRRDLFQAAFAEEARLAGLPLSGSDRVEAHDGPAEDPTPAVEAGSGEAEPGVSDEGDDGYGGEGEGYDAQVQAGDVVFGADEELQLPVSIGPTPALPLPVAAAAQDLVPSQPIPEFLMAFEEHDPEDAEGWPSARDGPSMSNGHPSPGAKVAPGLWKDP